MKEELINHILLFGYYAVPKARIQSIIHNASKKQLVIAIIHCILTSIFVSLGLTGILDGTEVVNGLLSGNPYVWSLTLFDYGIVMFLLMFACVFGGGFVLPLLVSLLINLLKSPKKRVLINDLVLSASYFVLSLAFYIPLVLSFGFIGLGQNPQLAFIEPQEFWDGLLTVGIVVLSFSFLISLYGYWKLFNPITVSENKVPLSGRKSSG